MKKVFGAIKQHFNKKNFFSLVALLALFSFFMKFDGLKINVDGATGNNQSNGQVSNIISNFIEKEQTKVLWVEYEEGSLDSFFEIEVTEALDSSHYVGSNEYPATYCVDGKLSTMWQDGEEGNGEGSTLTFRFDEKERLHYIRIYGGSGKSDKSYKENGRVQDITLYIDGEAYEVTLKDENKYQLIQIDGEVYCEEVVLVVQSVYEGTKYQETCVAEVTFYTE